MSHLRHWVRFVLGVLLLVGPEAAHGQSIVHGEISGRVAELNGVPLGEAEITATDDRTGVARWTTSANDGAFRIDALASGRYTVRVEALGFRPTVYLDVPVRPNQRLDFSVDLLRATPPVQEVDTVSYSGRVGQHLAMDGGRWHSAEDLSGYTDLKRGLAEVAELSTGWDSYGGSQGLPSRLSQVYVDGVPFEAAQHPFGWSSGPMLAALPRGGLGQLHVMDAPLDVELTGGAGGYVAASTRSAANRSTGSLGASASSEMLWSSDAFQGTAPGGVSYWGDGEASLPLAGDSSRLFVSLGGLSAATPRSSPISGNTLSQVARETGLPVGEAWLDETEIFTGLMRFDWAGASGTDVMVRVNASRSEDGGGRFFGHPADYGTLPSSRATDLSGLASVSSPIGSRFRLEVRAGFERSERLFGDEAEAGIALPSTVLIEHRDRLGASPGHDGSVLRTGVVGSSALHVDLGDHRLKGGFDASIPSYEYAFSSVEESGFYFSSEDELDARSGGFVGTLGARRRSTFSVPKIGGFLQYRWTPIPELTLTSGVRVGQEFLPVDEISPNKDWAELTGQANVDVPSTVASWGGRIGVTWDLTGGGGTLLSASLAASSDEVDPAALHQVITLDGSPRTRRVVGSLGSWPEAPAAGSSGTDLPVLALLDPDLVAPLTTRASAALLQRLSEGVALRLTGTFRRTEFLQRRTDLNLPVAGISDTNQGRPVFGELAKSGSVLLAVPGSNRRFAEFDRVWALNADGWSEYLGAGLGLEFVRPWVDLTLEYTYSRTEDNWIGAAAGTPDARLGPGLGAGGAGPESTVWEEGRSDFDLPHRFVASGEVHLDAPLVDEIAIGTTLRIQSGFPFTPTYAAGIDVNGDGSSSNDPALIRDMPEIRALTSEWSCLDASIGTIAERNGCRAPTSYTLDAHVSLTAFRIGGARGLLYVEGLNLLDAELGPRDSALLLVDPDAALEYGSDGEVMIPTMVNPGFGDLLAPTGFGRRLRIGVEVGAP